MKIGLMLGASQGPDASLEGLIAEARRAEEAGFSRLALANIFSFDAILALTLAGQKTRSIELATAVVPTYPRHPTALAQQALTASAATDGRFVLGIGLSHKVVIEDMLGLDFDRPAVHMREYLEVLTPLLRGEPVDHRGERFNVRAELGVPGARPVPLLVAALGPVMLGITGRLADGTSLWMTGPKTVASHVAPLLTAAAERAHRPRPRIVGGYPVVVTDDADAARAEAAQLLGVYGNLPSYRSMLDREGVSEPTDIALIGSEDEVASRMQVLADAGVSDFDAAITTLDGDLRQRTFEFLGRYAQGLPASA